MRWLLGKTGRGWFSSRGFYSKIVGGGGSQTSIL